MNWGDSSNSGKSFPGGMDIPRTRMLTRISHSYGGREEALKMKAQQAAQTTKTEGQTVLQQGEEKGKSIIQQSEAKLKEVKDKVI